MLPIRHSANCRIGGPEDAVSEWATIQERSVTDVHSPADVKPESEPALREVAKLLQENAKLQLYVVGHTDAIGTLNSNMDLSQRRAEATVNVLTGKYGVALVRLRSWGDGPTAPVATNKTEDGRAKNRRVELVEQ